MDRSRFGVFSTQRIIEVVKKKVKDSNCSMIFIHFLYDSSTEYVRNKYVCPRPRMFLMRVVNSGWRGLE